MLFIKKIKQNELFKNTFIYTVLQLFNSAIPFLLLPILTRYLTPDDYGMIATWSTFTGFLGIFIGLSMFGAIGVNYFHFKQEELAKYIGNVLILLLISTSIVTLLTWSFQPYLIEKLKLPLIWLYIAIIATWMRMITGINLVLWRSKKKAKSYSLYLLGQTLFDILLSLFFVVILHFGWEGRGIGKASAAIIFGLFSLFLLHRNRYVILNFSVTYIKDALKFGIPLIPHQLALWMRGGVDILLITSLVGVSQTGLYNVGLQFGMIIGLFVGAFNNAYVPYFYEKLKNITPETKSSLVKFTYFYFIGIIIFAMILSSCSIFIIPYLLDEKFINASIYIYWISLAYAFQGMYVMVVNYIFYTKKNHLISMTTITTSIFHVILSYFLIIKYGAIGAAYASVISYFLTFILIWRISNKVFPMPWVVFWVRK